MFHSVGTATMRLSVYLGSVIAPCEITLPNQRGQIWRLAEMYCFISKEIIFDQYAVMDGEPV